MFNMQKCFFSETPTTITGTRATTTTTTISTTTPTTTTLGTTNSTKTTAAESNSDQNDYYVYLGVAGGVLLAGLWLCFVVLCIQKCKNRHQIPEENGTNYGGRPDCVIEMEERVTLEGEIFLTKFSKDSSRKLSDRFSSEDS